VSGRCIGRRFLVKHHTARRSRDRHAPAARVRPGSSRPIWSCNAMCIIASLGATLLRGDIPPAGFNAPVNSVRTEQVPASSVAVSDPSVAGRRSRILKTLRASTLGHAPLQARAATGTQGVLELYGACSSRQSGWKQSFYSSSRCSNPAGCCCSRPCDIAGDVRSEARYGDFHEARNGYTVAARLAPILDRPLDKRDVLAVKQFETARTSEDPKLLSGCESTVRDRRR
jgi:hypothetical protein